MLISRISIMQKLNRTTTTIMSKVSLLLLLLLQPMTATTTTKTAAMMTTRRHQALLVELNLFARGADRAAVELQYRPFLRRLPLTKNFTNRRHCRLCRRLLSSRSHSSSSSNRPRLLVRPRLLFRPRLLVRLRLCWHALWPPRLLHLQQQTRKKKKMTMMMMMATTLPPPPTSAQSFCQSQSECTRNRRLYYTAQLAFCQQQQHLAPIVKTPSAPSRKMYVGLFSAFISA